MKRVIPSSFLPPHKKRKNDKSLLDTVPIELIFNIIKYIQSSTDINKFVYSIPSLRDKFNNDEIWKSMLYQNLVDPIINEDVLYRDNYFNNMNLYNKYNLKIIPVGDPKTDYYIISVNNNVIEKITEDIHKFKEYLTEFQNMLYQQNINSEYVKLYVGDRSVLKILFIEKYIPEKNCVHRTILSHSHEDREFIKVYDQIYGLIRGTEYDVTSYDNKICVQSNILTADDIIRFIGIIYEIFIFKNEFSSLFSYKYKGCGVVGCQMETLI